MATIFQHKNKIWYLQYTPENGKQTKVSTGTKDKREAERVLDKTKTHLVRKEFDLLPRPKEERCVRDFLDGRIRYIQDTKHVATAIVEMKRLEQLRDFFLIKNIVMLSDVRPAHFEEFLTLRSKTCAVKTLNEQLRIIKRAFEDAVEGMLIQKNPARSIKSLRRPDASARDFFFWTLEEVEKIAAEAETDCDQQTFLILVNTGCRLGEIMHAEWADVDFTERLLHIRNKPEMKWWTKSRQIRAIPLNDVALENLRLLYKAKVDNFIVHNPVIRSNGNFWHHIRKMMRAAGVTKGSVHCTRHTFASHLAMKGVDLPIISKLLGHADMRSTMIYAHLSPKHYHDAVSELNLGGTKEKPKLMVIPFQQVG